ncbi:Ser/Thr and Tyr protein phosphatase (dual specificity) [Enhygromyxa salina]|uniref:Ser/Thr and Tyr protein phosphatase (Dual specificity) n=1 Tax=Enhygromyxa salina TaxID=215803 RepID=A0A0C2CLR5_9BACT|nr:Ser/Thr and Tyr protein phosphatase (dual specificity) [Enhygromyxa salina]
MAKRVGMWALSLTLLLCFYALGKLSAAVFEPSVLPLTALDRAVPFLPWTVWLYGTITWVSLFAWLTIPTRADGARLMTSILIASATCALVFVVFPTSFPRELYPLTQLDSASQRELARLRAADSPSNCLPSLHVALAWGIALTWASALKHRRVAWLAAIAWAVTISVTTLTTKQHFFVDVPSGMIVGVFAWWAAAKLFPGSTSTPAWVRSEGLTLTWDTHKKAAAKLRLAAQGYQWSLDEVDWPTGPLPPLDPLLVRLISELIYIEEIAGMNFAILAKASTSDDLRALYGYFADEERRHANGLRRVLALHGASVRPPGLGNSLVLDEFDALDHESDADVLLIATANPVFETMLDAGTVPFLRTHPALRSPWFDDFVKRITRDESAHLAVNWMVVREAGQRYRGLAGLSLLLNPSIYRGMVAVPFMSLDVYSLAHAMGYRFETLMPAFGKLWRLHKRYAELRGFPLWSVFRVFTAAGAIATIVSARLARAGLIFVRFWTAVTSVTDLFARLVFGRRLLSKRGLE